MLELIPPAAHAKVESNAVLRDTMDKAPAVETVARELLDEIREAFTKEQWRIQQADRATEHRLQSIGNAANKEVFTKAQFAGWQNHYEAFIHEQNQALEQAQYATQQAKYEHNQACQEVEMRHKAAISKDHLGMIAICTVMDRQSELSVKASNRIFRSMDAQQDLMDSGASVA